jgi:hypothetical protein
MLDFQKQKQPAERRLLDARFRGHDIERLPEMQRNLILA